MMREIVGFSQDEERHWRAELECGHYQHVRYDPPLRTREWVLSATGRGRKIGARIDCKKCTEGMPKDFQTQ